MIERPSTTSASCHVFTAICFLTPFALRAQDPLVETTIPSTLPEGFSREPGCSEGTVCVAEHLFLAAEDFRSIVELTTRDLPPEFNQISISSVMSGIVLVVASTDPSDGSSAGSRFLVEATPAGWAILRRQIFLADGSIPVSAEDYKNLGIISTEGPLDDAE